MSRKFRDRALDILRSPTGDFTGTCVEKPVLQENEKFSRTEQQLIMMGIN